MYSTTCKTQSLKQKQSALMAERKWVSNYAFRVEQKSKMNLRALPKSDFSQNTISSYFVMKNA